MRLARIFFAIVVVSLFVGCNSAFNDNSSKSEVADNQEIVDIDNEKQQEIIETNQEEEAIETEDMPKELEKTTSNSNNTSNTFEQQNKKTETKKTTEEKVLNTNSNSSNDNYVQNSKETETKEEKPQITVDNSVDTSSLDYNEHKGRIDCGSSDECMNIALPIQFRFKQSITNSFFIDVMSNSGNSLGYFIEYVFKENTYSSNEECEKIGNEIKQTLRDRVIGYQCNGSALKINTDY